jgi:hypothetical protein
MLITGGADRRPPAADLLKQIWISNLTHKRCGPSVPEIMKPDAAYPGSLSSLSYLGFYHRLGEVRKDPAFRAGSSHRGFGRLMEWNHLWLAVFGLKFAGGAYGSGSLDDRLPESFPWAMQHSPIERYDFT